MDEPGRIAHGPARAGASQREPHARKAFATSPLLNHEAPGPQEDEPATKHSLFNTDTLSGIVDSTTNKTEPTAPIRSQCGLFEAVSALFPSAEDDFPPYIAAEVGGQGLQKACCGTGLLPSSLRSCRKEEWKRRIFPSPTPPKLLIHPPHIHASQCTQPRQPVRASRASLLSLRPLPPSQLDCVSIPALQLFRIQSLRTSQKGGRLSQLVMTPSSLPCVEHQPWLFQSTSPAQPAELGLAWLSRCAMALSDQPGPSIFPSHLHHVLSATAFNVFVP
ncbi:hypothetical protein B0T10DRAFT_574117 [Thelonectria olida]|uniref:Uncharacterized protein n=1 Tax=Thelonectria olida TaxID=1576542 RepID=A0A9P9AP75_9HYPO|nr:hypothetical protein B0T10DRAFT_574117 [Thelonectria olida]